MLFHLMAYALVGAVEEYNKGKYTVLYHRR